MQESAEQRSVEAKSRLCGPLGGNHVGLAPSPGRSCGEQRDQVTRVQIAARGFNVESTKRSCKAISIAC